MNLFNFFLLASSGGEAETFNEASIINLAEAMDKFGILTVIIAAMVVCIGVFVVFVLAANKKKSDNLTALLKEQNENTIKQNNLLLEKITELTEQHHNETKTEKNLVNIFMRLNNTLKDECHEVQINLDCARVGIYACHNGSKTNTGLPFFKTSCISEWISKKYLITSGIGIHTDLQLGIFYNFVKEVFENGYCVIKNTESDKHEFENASAYRYLTTLEVKSSVIVAIVNSEDLHIGAVTMEFKTPLDDNDKINMAIKEGKQLAEKIAPLLDYSLCDENYDI